MFMLRSVKVTESPLGGAKILVVKRTNVWWSIPFFLL